jgi:thiol-disulfide isomerase/thioredoxin
LDGGESTLDGLLSNGPILLAFFKISCPVCQMTFPYLERLHNAGVLPVYAVSQNDEEDTRWFHSEFGVTLPTLLDREENDFAVSNAFAISSVPTLFLIERDGTIARTIEGWVKQDIESLGEFAGVPVFREGDNVPAWKAG